MNRRNIKENVRNKPMLINGYVFREGVFRTKYCSFLIDKKVRECLKTNEIASNNHQMEVEDIILSGAIYIESWVNAYGVEKLGYKFFSNELEMMPVIKKILFINAILNKSLAIDNGHSSNILWLFKKRNDLVHTKTIDASAATLDGQIKKMQQVLPCEKSVSVHGEHAFITFTDRYSVLFSYIKNVMRAIESVGHILQIKDLQEEVRMLKPLLNNKIKIIDHTENK